VYSTDAAPPIRPDERGSPAEANKLNTNRWAFAFGSNFKGINLSLGQLVYYRKISPDKLQANAVAGLFAGWRLEAGCAYRGQTYVLSYSALKHQTGNYWDPLSVDERELFVPEGDPVFPLRRIAQQALAEFKDPSPGDLDDRDQCALPWVAEAIASGKRDQAIKAIRPRNAPITFSRLMDLGPTLGCKGCTEASNYHNAECRKRFNDKYGTAPVPEMDETAPEPELEFQVPAPADAEHTPPRTAKLCAPVGCGLCPVRWRARAGEGRSRTPGLA
jgi:hypothetical protein